MSRTNCCNNTNECLIISIAASVVIGIVAAVLTITGIIAVTPAFLWVVFGIAVVYLAIAFVISSLRRFSTPLSSRSTVATLIAGILGTILLSVILLAIVFPATSALGAVLVGLLLASFSLIITSTACLVLNTYSCDD
ncbi:MAG: hypothetical protein E7513_01945 [Ruminococcaceae bacterium]|nr:hypothetical protein [Oscillospiraceae bacterium]